MPRARRPANGLTYRPSRKGVRVTLVILPDRVGRVFLCSIDLGIDVIARLVNR